MGDGRTSRFNTLRQFSQTAMTTYGRRFQPSMPTSTEFRLQQKRVAEYPQMKSDSLCFSPFSLALD
jgi:hypothetical protein